MCEILNRVSGISVWIGLIILLVTFTGILVWQGNHVTAQEQTQVETVTEEDSVAYQQGYE